MEELIEVFGGYSGIFFCTTCNCLCIKCKDCNNISCSGGGCDKCHDRFEAFEELNRDFYESICGFNETYNV